MDHTEVGRYWVDIADVFIRHAQEAKEQEPLGIAYRKEGIQPYD
ncbi:MAG: hypothetical protein U9R25_18530 [Chloroflexota bacterium]|nr:hypothetical protein [Chloroflexota bacterium]